MVVEFSVKNFRSFKELQTISFMATGLKSSEEYAEVDENNIVQDAGINLLKTIGIYGANNSGKSNMIKAIEYFIQAIRNEASSESNLALLCDPYLYQDNPVDTESFFQIVLIVDRKKFRYGFTVKKNSDIREKGSREVIINEWLFGTKEKNSGEYFTRTGLEIQKDKLPNDAAIPAVPYAHTLFLTHAAAFDAGGVCALIRSFFKQWTISNFSGNFEPFRFHSLRLIEIAQRKEDFLRMLSIFDLYYDDAYIERDLNESPYSMATPEKIFFIKTFRDGNKETSVRLNLALNESAGTLKLFDIAGFLLQAFNFTESGFVILDEIDSNFHPSLLLKMISLFNDRYINQSKVQLLFTSHDTNLLSPAIMRRDQFYFAEKRNEDATRIYSLSDLKGIRNDADFARHYLAGFYGAIPLLEQITHNIPTQHDDTLGY
jgi:AAA15 family ATPase/GTPase